MTAAHERYRDFLENLTAENLSSLEDYVAKDVHFKDPFNDVRGLDAMARVFRHMFENVADVRFNVRHALHKDDTCLMDWRFEGRLNRRSWVFDGASVVRFDPDGRVVEHIDHWDAASAFYERLPVIGWLLAIVRSRLEAR